MHPYSSTDTTSAGKKLRFILSVMPDIHITDSLSIVVHAFASRVSMSVSVDETLRPSYVNCQLVSESCNNAHGKCGDVAYLIKAHMFRFEFIDIEIYACSGSFQIM